MMTLGTAAQTICSECSAVSLKRTTIILSSYSGRAVNEIHNKLIRVVPKDSFRDHNHGLMLIDGVALNFFAGGRWVFRRLFNLVFGCRVINPCFVSCNKALRMFHYFIKVTCQMCDRDRKTHTKSFVLLREVSWHTACTLFSLIQFF